MKQVEGMRRTKPVGNCKCGLPSASGIHSDGTKYRLFDDGRCRTCNAKKKADRLTPEQQREIDAAKESIRENVNYFEHMLMGIWKYQMKSVQSITAEGEEMKPSEAAIKIDAKAKKHLDWVMWNVILPARQGTKHDEIAKATSLTKGQIRRIIHNALIRERYPLRLVVE